MRQEYLDRLQDKIADKFKVMDCEELFELIVETLKIHDADEWCDEDFRGILLGGVWDYYYRVGKLNNGNGWSMFPELALALGVDYTYEAYEYDCECEKREMEDLNSDYFDGAV